VLRVYTRVLLDVYARGAQERGLEGGPQVVSGTRAVREALSDFLAMKRRMTLESRTLAEAGGIALTTSKWVLEGTGPVRSAPAL